jgi:hypothetical protein
MAYVLLRMLERWGSKHGGLYIRKTKKKKAGKQSENSSLIGLNISSYLLSAMGVPEEEGVVDDASDEDVHMNEEILQEMTLEKFEHVSRRLRDINPANSFPEICKRGSDRNSPGLPIEVSGI